MSLVSVKNLVAPFTNSTHLVTIVLVTILFALFRLQGGNVLVSREGDRQGENTNSRTYRTSVPPKEESASSESLDDLNAEINSFGKSPARAAEVNEIPDKGTITITREEEEDLLGEMIGSKPLPPKREVDAQAPKRQPSTQRQGSQQSDSLEDIERSLGLR